MDAVPPVQSRRPVPVATKQIERPCPTCPLPTRTVKLIARVSYVPEIIRTADEF
jgi:hypothetical protein